ncbi:MAG TPA: PAS domain-containing protein, partial [Verrucomicrobiae bacterium]|nr:PAS domain-containing protein [Verrucomicrobiae bacterium]
MKTKPAPVGDEMRRQAEAKLSALPRTNFSGFGEPKSAADTRRLLHELQVHQIELEMQNAELRQTRDELEASLENFTDLYDFAPVGYFTLTADSSIRQANLTGADLVGVERSRLVGRCFDRLLPAGLQPAFHDFLKKALAGPAKQSGDFEIMRPRQLPRAVNIEAQCLPDRSACRVVVKDITERKQAEDKVRVSEIRYRRLFETAHDGVLLLDPSTGRITDANPFMIRLLDYDHAQLVGKQLFEIG